MSEQADYITTSEAAEITGRSRSGIIKWCVKHGIGKKIGRDWMITRKELEDYVPVKRGRRVGWHNE